MSGGFDCFVGNPPFAGKNTLAAANRAGYGDWLKAIHAGSHGNADLVAHFFRRAFSLLRHQGTFGLLATNTIAQGDTRATGLRWICQSGGVIYAARRRYKWPGLAAVVVSVVHVVRGSALSGEPILDGRPVTRISAFLFHRGGDDDPVALTANSGKSFIGNYINGSGFTFDDDKADATSLSEMQRIIGRDQRNAEVIFPYIGGDEVLNDPRHRHRRYVINFGARTEADALLWPDVFAILLAKVKSFRQEDKRETYRRHWWQHAEKRPELAAATANMSRFLFHPNLSVHLAFVFLDAGIVVGAPHNVFAFDSHAVFALLQSRVHECWARFFSSSMKDDLRYTPSVCFETFPFPPGIDSNATVESTGKVYYDVRAALMVKNDEGLTDTYNRFNDPAERSPDILKLRELHAEMDHAVLDAYGWTDIRPDYGFREQLDESIRLTWREDTRDEILARLLELNRVVAEGEAEAEEKRPAPEATKKGPKKRKKTDAAAADLFPDETPSKS